MNEGGRLTNLKGLNKEGKALFLRVNEPFDKDRRSGGSQSGVYRLRQVPLPFREGVDDPELLKGNSARNYKFYLQDTILGDYKPQSDGGFGQPSTINPHKIVGGVNIFDQALQDGRVEIIQQQVSDED